MPPPMSNKVELSDVHTNANLTTCLWCQHHACAPVSSSALEITFIVNILSISALVLPNNNNGTFPSTCKADGWALSFSLI